MPAFAGSNPAAPASARFGQEHFQPKLRANGRRLAKRIARIAEANRFGPPHCRKPLTAVIDEMLQIAPPGAHPRGGFLDPRLDPEDVELPEALGPRGIGLRERARRRNSGIVDYDVELAGARDRVFGQRRDFGGVGRIGAAKSAASAVDLGSSVDNVRCKHVCACRVEPFRDRGANARRRSGDNCGLAGKVEHEVRTPIERVPEGLIAASATPYPTGCVRARSCRHQTHGS